MLSSFVFVVQRRQRNVQTSVMHVQNCCFARLNLLLFCRSRCRRPSRRVNSQVTAMDSCVVFIRLWEEGAGVLPYKGMCRPKGWGFALFWSGVGYGFRGNYRTVWTYCRFSSKLVRKREIPYANSKRILRDPFCCCSYLSNFLEARSENGSEKWHFLVRNKVRMRRTGRQTLTHQE